MDDLRFAFAKNRAEELDRDVFNKFVVPLYYDKLEVRKQRKSFVLIGGRGCGKTTLLRYLSHETQFSKSKIEIDAKDLSYIGLYIRADTNFLSTLNGGGIAESTWKAAFRHSLACDVGIEVLKSLSSINCNPTRVTKFGGLSALRFEDLQSFDPQIGQGLQDVRKYLEQSRDMLSVWVNNLDFGGRQPLFLPGERFLRRLLETLQRQLPYLSDSLYAVFVDEYENLHEYQQRIINGLIKHGEFPLVFNVAVKRNGMPIRATDGDEAIQDIADYREVDLEQRLADGFELFCAELLFARLGEYQIHAFGEYPVDANLLRDVAAVEMRRTNKGYQERVLGAARELFPRPTEKEIATLAFLNARIKDKLLSNIQVGLKAWNSDLDPNQFARADVPEASIVSSALLARRRERPDLVLKELEAYAAHAESRFTSSGWIHNNLFGCLLQLYSNEQSVCPLYAGFDAYVVMARTNIRHFLELIHRTLVGSSDWDGKNIPVDHQAESVRAASSNVLREIRGCGLHGNQLHGMVLTLGTIFRLRQQRLEQSEPEVNHFHITSGDLDEELFGYLNEAVKWSVLFEEDETKKKNLGTRTSEYVLNPVFSAHFQISYRKKRSLPVQTSDLRTMFSGKLEDRDRVVRRLAGQDVHPNFLLDLRDESSEP